MRLLNTTTERLEDTSSHGAVPEYAILSHRWGDGEVTFQDLQPQPWYMSPSKYKTKPGYYKVHGCCQQALKDGIEYVWIDTCCIDKSSSTELSEAINSMWEWYRKAKICYAFLSDVGPKGKNNGSPVGFRESQWFTRGWTLQELLAPNDLHFYDCLWQDIGTKIGLRVVIGQTTGIGLKYLGRYGAYYVHKASVAQRMSWAARRNTTRVEDIAYCLLGLFAVNMPLLYGEGKRAFVRLQEEIIRRSGDQSVFAWGYRSRLPQYRCFAISPSDYEHCGEVEILGSSPHHPLLPFAMTNVGLQISIPVLMDESKGVAFASLRCGVGGQPLALVLRETSEGHDHFERTRFFGPRLINTRALSDMEVKTIYISGDDLAEPYSLNHTISISRHRSANFKVIDIYPPHAVASTDESFSNIILHSFPQTVLLCETLDTRKFLITIQEDQVPESAQSQKSHVKCYFAYLPSHFIPPEQDLDSVDQDWMLFYALRVPSFMDTIPWKKELSVEDSGLDAAISESRMDPRRTSINLILWTR